MDGSVEVGGYDGSGRTILTPGVLVARSTARLIGKRLRVSASLTERVALLKPLHVERAVPI